MNPFRLGQLTLFMTLALVVDRLPADAQEEIRVPAANMEALQETLDKIQRLRDQGNQEPISVSMPAGTYRLLKPLQLSKALVGEGLKLVAQESGKVVISSGIPLQVDSTDEMGWIRYRIPKELLERDIPRCILVEGRLRTAARYPNVGYLRIKEALPDHRSGFLFRQDELPTNIDTEHHVCDLIFLHDWSSSRLPVREIDDQRLTLKTLGPIGCSAEHYKIDHFEAQPRYYLEGHPRFADLPGEWYVDQGACQLVLLGNAGQEPPRVEIPTLDTLISASGDETSPLRGLELVGIHFTGTRFPMPSGGMAAAQATMHEPRNSKGERATADRPMLPAAVEVEIATGCRVINCRFASLGGSAIWLAGRTVNGAIERCHFVDIGGNAVNLGENNSRQIDGQIWYQVAPSQVPTNNRVVRCSIQRAGKILPGSVAIWAALQKHLDILENQLDDCPYTGISLGWIWSDVESPAGENRIRGNQIQRMMQVLSDGGGIYTLGRQPGSVIEDNVIADIPLNAGRAESNGMFLDEGTTGFTIRRNTIRRTAKSPLRFHRASTNLVSENRWELPNDSTPAIRFNATPESNITQQDNAVLAPETSIFLIGNSLTWDTLPNALDGNVHWHVDCGKPLPYIATHPQQPCVESSWEWPAALEHFDYDFLSVQPFYGSSFNDDLNAILGWIELEPRATIVIHTGWPRHVDFVKESSNPIAGDITQAKMTHHPSYCDKLIAELQRRYPDRRFVKTQAMSRLSRIASDIESQKAPFDSLEELYRDAIHMTTGPGRYLMHNTMRQALGQPRSDKGFEKLDPDVKSYLDQILSE